MSKQSGLIMSTLAGGLLITAGIAHADQTDGIYLAAGSAMENTQLNVRDKAGTNIIPDEQNNTAQDITITADIRKAVVNDKSLSINAHNVKIITRNGVVTLRGPVESETENTKLQKIVEKTYGVKQIDNQLENKAP